MRRRAHGHRIGRRRPPVGGPAALALTGALTVVFGLAGCSSASGPADPPPSTRVITRTETVAPSAPVPPTLTAVPPLVPGAAPPAGQREQSCPYLASGTVADIVGSHVYRTTTGDQECRFFFYAAPYNAVADIVQTTYGSAADAVTAMTVLASAPGREGRRQPGIGPGIDGALFRAPLVAADDGRDWACAFTAGATLVVVRTQRTDTSQPALDLATAVAQRR